MGRSYRPSGALASGWWYWSLAGMRGASTSVARSPVWQFRVGVRDSAIDSSVGTSVDFNGDGYGDLVAGAQATGTTQGAVHFYAGNATGIPVEPTASIPGTISGLYLGHSVASAGDINGDGLSDVLVGARGQLPGSGFVGVVLGSERGVASMFHSVIASPPTQVLYGATLRAIGDINGDGYGDVAIGSRVAMTAGQTSVELFLGSASGALALHRTMSWTHGRFDFTPAITALGDGNLDGYDDFAIAEQGDPLASGPYGAIRVFYGSASGASPTPAFVIEGAEPSEYIARHLEYGDINGDGRVDLIAANMARDGTGPNASGAVRVFFATPTGFSVASSQLINGTSAMFNNYGQWLSAGDVNHDGYDDIAVGSRAEACSLGNCGAVEVRLGSATGLQASATRVQHAMRGMIGQDISARGDFNNDGFADVVYGVAWRQVAPLTYSAGFFDVHMGNASGIPAMMSFTRTDDSYQSDLGGALAH